jgi:type IV secretory pathway TrbL component
MIKEIIERIKSDSPSFFKKLRNLSITLVSVILVMLEANTMFELNIEENIISILKNVVFILSGIAGTSILTKR